MTFWMFRHKPTGLFFKNRKSTYRQRGGRAPNLNEKGKVYLIKPSFDWIAGTTFITPKSEIVGLFVEADWEIVEFNSAEQPTNKEEK